jgi:methenyltetrahydromethanopterin cyclohydrolase
MIELPSYPERETHRMLLNESGLAAVEPLLTGAAQAGVALHHVGGVRVVDCGVREPGGIDVGITITRAALAGRGEVALERDAAFENEWPDCPWPVVTVSSDEPVAACLASQYAGWKVSRDDYFAMASGPLRAAIGREDLFDEIGMRERPPVAVGLLEASSLPPEPVCHQLAHDARVAPEKLVLLVARTASPAGTLQVIARSLETALHKLHDLRFDLRRIQRGHGRAPLAPVPKKDLIAIGRTNDAILYGGQVVLEVTGDDESLLAIGPQAVSQASPDYGAPFSDLFERAGRDFYALDPALFAPAMIDFVNVDSGRRHRFGNLAPAVVQRSFTSPAEKAAGAGA